MRSWFRRHASALFVALLFVVTCACFFVGLYLTEDNTGAQTHQAAVLRAFGIILINLSGVGVAAAVTTIFFTFNDVQN